MASTDTQKPKCRHILSSQKSLVMTTKDTEAKMAYSLSIQKSLVMTTSIKDALSHTSVSGAVKSKF